MSINLINLSNWFSVGLKIIGIIVFAAFIYYLFKLFGEKWLRKITEKSYEIKDKEAIEKRVKTLYSLLLNILKIIIIFIVFFIILDEIGVNIAPFLTGAGIIGLAIGFGSQTLVKDFISGLFILIEDQFRKGDIVKIGNIEGTIEDFTLRRTLIRDEKNNFYYIPNSQINVVCNFSKGRESKKNRN